MNKKSHLYLFLACSVALCAGGPALADKMASPVSVKIGYFNLALVKASYPETAGFDALKTQAENQLRSDLEQANKQIQQMQDAKKSSDDIQKAVRDNQLAINAKQQALAELLQSQNAIAREKIQQNVQAVAKEKNLDMVVDGEGLFSGGKLVLDNGVDITEAIVKRLRPQTSSTDATTAVDQARTARPK